MSVAFATGICLVGCDSGNQPENPDPIVDPDKPDTPEKKDYYNDVTKQLKLTKEYEGKKFVEDGIGEATFNTAADGDTASFKLVVGGNSVTIRFYCVDTPESTGGVEKWGKNASFFTKERLESATGIVLEASTTPASVDSYGSRYLAYIWYKTEQNPEWTNLNLELVENGYSECKALYSDAYYNYFTQAEAVARKVPLHIWSDDEDPYYSTEAEEVTLKQLATNPDAYYNEESGVGSKVRFTGYVSNTVVSNSGTYMYKVSDVVDGVIYTFNVYAGYTSSGIPNYMKIGGKFTITGSLQLYNGNYQVSGLTYVPMQSGGDYLSRSSKEYFITFNSNIASNDVSLYYPEALYKDATVLTAEVNNQVLTITAKAIGYEEDAEEETFTFKCNVLTTIDTSSLVGKKFSVTGYQETKNSNIIEVLSYSNFNFK